jgi:ferredoxin/quercetin dioxygenase-like cupin family protein
MPTITFVTHDRHRHSVDVPEGASLMQATKPFAFALEGACGGRMGCATCHVVVPEPWFSRLALWSEQEERVLEAARGITPVSRLGCQVIVDGSMDGMVVHLPEAFDFDAAVERFVTSDRRGDGSRPIEVDGPVAYMHPDDLGRWHVPGSRRRPATIVPDYAAGQDGVDTIKVLFASDTHVMFESFRRKGTRDTAHIHPDHDALVYQKKGRVLMRVGAEVFVVEEGDTYFHPRGVLHQHEALEDSVRIETKHYPKGGAIAAWNALVAGSGAEIPVLGDV